MTTMLAPEPLSSVATSANNNSFGEIVVNVGVLMVLAGVLLSVLKLTSMARPLDEIV